MLFKDNKVLLCTIIGIGVGIFFFTCFLACNIGDNTFGEYFSSVMGGA